MRVFNLTTLRTAVTRCLACVLIPAMAIAPAWGQPVGAPSLGPASAADLTPALERRLGEAIMVDGRHDPDFISDPDISQYLNAMGRRLAANAPGGAPDIEVFGVRDPVLNAFEMPGGFIGVNTGLIVGTAAESELAGVLAHEISHVTQRHIARGLTQQNKSAHILLATLAAAVAAAFIPGAGNLAAGAAAFGQAAAMEQQLGFSRDAEQEADRMGFEILRKAEYDPNGMAQMFAQLSKAANLNEGAGGGIYVSTHPLGIQRMSDMQNRIRQLAPATYRESDEYWFVRAKSRVVQATDPKALRQAVEQMQEETRTTDASAIATVRRSAAWYGISFAALARKDIKEANRALQQAGAGAPPSPYLDVQRIDIALAGQDYAKALSDSQAGIKRWPGRRAFVIREAQALQLAGKDKEAIAFLQEQTKRWMGSEPVLFQMLAKSQERMGEAVVARQTMATYYSMMGMFPAALTQLTQARTMTQDFYVQSQLDVEIRSIKARIAEDRRLLERFKS